MIEHKPNGPFTFPTCQDKINLCHIKTYQGDDPSRHINTHLIDKIIHWINTSIRTRPPSSMGMIQNAQGTIGRPQIWAQDLFQSSKLHLGWNPTRHIVNQGVLKNHVHHRYLRSKGKIIPLPKINLSCNISRELSYIETSERYTSNGIPRYLTGYTKIPHNNPWLEKPPSSWKPCRLILYTKQPIFCLVVIKNCP